MNRKSVIEKSESMIGKINKRYSLSTSEAFEIHQKFPGPIEAIAASFRYGYMQGAKATKAELKRQKPLNN